MERQNPSKIEVLAGIGNDPVYWEEELIGNASDYCFAIVLDGDRENAIKLKYSGQTAESACEAAGKELNGKLREIEAKDYLLVNGERIRHSTHERIKCTYLVSRELEIFEQYLSTGIKKKPGFGANKQEAVKHSGPSTA